MEDVAHSDRATCERRERVERAEKEAGSDDDQLAVAGDDPSREPPGGERVVELPEDAGRGVGANARDEDCGGDEAADGAGDEGGVRGIHVLADDPCGDVPTDCGGEEEQSECVEEPTPPGEGGPREEDDAGVEEDPDPEGASVEGLHG